MSILTDPPEADPLAPCAEQKEEAILKRWGLEIEVVADEGTGGRPVDWSYTAKFEHGSSGHNNGNKLTFPKNSGEYDIEFKLKDNTKFQLKFYSTPEDAIYAQVGTACPAAPGDASGYLELNSVTGGKKLSVSNLNDQDHKKDGDITITYALRFDGKAQVIDGKSYPPYVYDPIMSNGGKG